MAPSSVVAVAAAPATSRSLFLPPSAPFSFTGALFVFGEAFGLETRWEEWKARAERG